MLLSTAIEGYLLDIGASYSRQTVALYKMYMKQFLLHLGDMELEDIDNTDLAKYMIFLRNDYQWEKPDGTKHSLGGSALDNHWKVIRSFFGWAHRYTNLARPDLNLPRPRYQLPQIQAFTRDEIKRLLYSAEWTHEIHRADRIKAFRMHLPTAKRNKALLLLMLDTGLRIGEVSRLTLGDINLESGEVVVAPFGSGQKTKPRLVYLGRSAKRALWAYLAKETKRQVDPVFTVNSAYLRRLVAMIGDRAEVPDCHPHRFRHTFAIEYLRNSGDPFTLQRLLGHSTLEMAKRYLNIVDGDTKAAHERASPADHWKL